MDGTRSYIQEDLHDKVRFYILEHVFMAKKITFMQMVRSDVWSFGILLWEIMTLGASPYPSIQSMERLFEMLGQGYRMERPSGCSEDVYSIMRNCWSSNPMLRPSFSELVTDLDRLLAMAKEVDYLVRSQILH